MIDCANCTFENIKEAKFCQNCSTRNDLAANFCLDCGTALETSPPSHAPAREGGEGVQGVRGPLIPPPPSERAVGGLTLALEHPGTPGIYRDIARRALADLEAVLDPDVFARAQDTARERGFEVLLAEIRGESTVQ